MDTTRRNTCRWYLRTISANASSSPDSQYFSASHASAWSVYKAGSARAPGDKDVVEDQPNAQEHQRNRQRPDFLTAKAGQLAEKQKRRNAPESQRRPHDPVEQRSARIG